MTVCSTASKKKGVTDHCTIALATDKVEWDLPSKSYKAPLAVLLELDRNWPNSMALAQNF